MQTSRDMTRTQTLLHLTSAPGRQLLGGVRSRDAAAPRLPHAHRPSGTRVNGPLGSGHARHARHPSTRGFDSRSKRPRRKFVKFQKENESGTSRGGLAWSSSTVHGRLRPEALSPPPPPPGLFTPSLPPGRRHPPAALRPAPAGPAEPPAAHSPLCRQVEDGPLRALCGTLRSRASVTSVLRCLASTESSCYFPRRHADTVGHSDGFQLSHLCGAWDKPPRP